MANTYQELLTLVGKDIEFLSAVEKYADEFDAGMRATVTGIAPDGDHYQIQLTLAKFEDYNRPFETPTYFDSDGKPTLTVREAGYYRMENYLYVEDNWRDCVKLLDDTSAGLFDLYLIDRAAGSDLTYIAWLETLVLAAKIFPQLTPKG